MKLLRLSLLSIAGCLVGLAVLVAMAAASYSRLQTADRGLTELLELHHRLDVFSAQSDILLLQGADAERWQEFQETAGELQRPACFGKRPQCRTRGRPG